MNKHDQLIYTIIGIGLLLVLFIALSTRAIRNEIKTTNQLLATQIVSQYCPTTGTFDGNKVTCNQPRGGETK